MKRFALLLMVLGLFTFAIGCEQGVQEEQQDVQEAEREAVDDVSEEHQETHEAAREGAMEIQEEKQDVQEAQQEQAKEQQEEAAPAEPVGQP